jgi:MoaA/NifB/PqqE/SkfB family radical SAM enzyme
MSAYSHDYKLRNEDLLWQTVERGDAYIPNFPPRLTFETSKRCNLACRMCYHFSTRFIQGRSTMDQPYMDLRLIEKVAEELFPTLQYYETTLLGDPFLAPYLDDELRLAGQYNVYMRPTTNGTTVTEKNIAKVNGRMDWLKCSFDSHIRGIYNAIRIGAEYETTIKRLKTFNRLREQMDPVPYFRMGLVLSDMNVDNLADYVAWCHEEMGVDDVEIMGINIDAPHVEPMALFDKAERVNRNLDAAVDLAIDRKYKLRLDFTRMPYPGSGRFVCQERSAELREIQKDFGFQAPRLFDRMSYVIRNPRNRHEIGDVGQVWSNNMRRMDRCLEFFNRPFVLDNGNIEGCGNCDTFLLGNLKRQNFSDIWNNDLYMDIRRKMFKGRIKENWYEPCNDCICMDVTYDRGRSDHRNRSFYRIYTSESAGGEKIAAALSHRPMAWENEVSLDRFRKRIDDFVDYELCNPSAGAIYLSDLPVLKKTLEPQARLAANKVDVWTPLAIGSRRYAKGLFVNGGAVITFPVIPGFSNFRAVVGLFDGGNPDRQILDDRPGTGGKVVFEILLDNEVVATTPEVDGASPGLLIDLPVAGHATITLKSIPIEPDHAWSTWCDARFCTAEPVAA